ncbi:hypothetical protein SDC9_94944 [bioreactor metagenome]|uniref:Uncharacterized protein n=1 Tax=bioreactor metagenome TaxID=1076179 RepID=A0A645A4V2_9ZZZZ
MDAIADAAVGEGGVRVGHVDRARLRSAQGDAVGRIPAARPRDTGVVRGPDDLLRTVLHLRGQVHEGGVDRGRGRLQQGHGAVLDAELVADRLGLSPGSEAVAAQWGVECEAVADPCDEAERLERRAGHPGRGGPVARVLHEIVTAVQGDQPTCLGVDRRDRGMDTGTLLLACPGRVGRLALVGPGRLLRGRLGRRLERRGDLQAPTVDLGVGEVEGPQLLLGHVDQEPPWARVDGLRRDVRQCRQCTPVFVELLLRDRLLPEHAREHVLVAGLEAGRVVRGDAGIEQTGVLDDRREHGRFGHRQILGILAEPALGRGLDAVRSATEVDSVEVVREDLVLRLPVVHLQRQHHFLQLAGDGALRCQVHQPDVLLGDGRAALQVTAGHDRAEGTGHAGGRDPRVRPERTVLSGDRRVLHRPGDLLTRHGDAVLFCQRGELGRPIGEVEARLAGLEACVRVGEPCDAVQAAEGQAGGQREADDSGHQPDEDLLPDSELRPP